jgi:hypothetical protein
MFISAEVFLQLEGIHLYETFQFSRVFLIFDEPPDRPDFQSAALNRKWLLPAFMIPQCIRMTLILEVQMEAGSLNPLQRPGLEILGDLFPVYSC